MTEVKTEENQSICEVKADEVLLMSDKVKAEESLSMSEVKAEVITLINKVSGPTVMGTLNVHNMETKSFQKLGPYETLRTVFESNSFHMLDPLLESGNPLFLIHREAFLGEKKGLAKLIVNFPLEGQMSPKHAVTLGMEDRKNANIPETAKHYVWSYPIDIEWRHYEEHLMRALKDCGCLGCPELMFLIMGGYVYFDDNYKIVAANAMICGQNRRKEEELIRTGEGLRFGNKMPFPAKFINQLTSFDRFKVVSWPGLSYLDYPPIFFAWLLPNEELVAPDRERRKFGPHGGFVFLFHDELDEQNPDLTDRNCYFPVICNDPEHCAESSSYILENKDPLAIQKDFSLRLNLTSSGKLGQVVEVDFDNKVEQTDDSPAMPQILSDEFEESSDDEGDSVVWHGFLRQASANPTQVSTSDHAKTPRKSLQSKIVKRTR